MEYIIKRIKPSGDEWIWASETESKEIESGQYMRGGVVHSIMPQKEYAALQNYIAVLEHRIAGMQEAVRRWRKKIKPEEYCESDGDLVHLRTEYSHRRYEDDGRWVCLKHMILCNVEPSEELGQLAYEEVMRLGPLLKKEGILPVRIYFCQNGWICIFDWTAQEPYM